MLPCSLINIPICSKMHQKLIGNRRSNKKQTFVWNASCGRKLNICSCFSNQWCVCFSAETAELDLDGQGGRMFLRVLLNLVMHNYPALVSGALQLLFRHFSQRQEVLQAFKQVGFRRPQTKKREGSQRGFCQAFRTSMCSPTYEFWGKDHRLPFPLSWLLDGESWREFAVIWFPFSLSKCLLAKRLTTSGTWLAQVTFNDRRFLHCAWTGAATGVGERRGELQTDQVGPGRAEAARREVRALGLQSQTWRGEGKEEEKEGRGGRQGQCVMLMRC